MRIEIDKIYFKLLRSNYYLSFDSRPQRPSLSADCLYEYNTNNYGTQKDHPVYDGFNQEIHELSFFYPTSYPDKY